MDEEVKPAPVKYGQRLPDGTIVFVTPEGVRIPDPEPEPELEPEPEAPEAPAKKHKAEKK